MRNTKILVTGGAGFIGSTLVKRLVAEGADVSVLDNLWRGSVENLRIVGGAYAIDIGSKFHLCICWNRLQLSQESANESRYRRVQGRAGLPC